MCIRDRNGFETSFEVVEEGEALDGAALRRQVKLTVTTDKGSSDAPVSYTHLAHSYFAVTTVRSSFSCQILLVDI